MIGRRIHSYEIVAPIGEGGMGTVYRGLDRMLDREVAVKALRPELVARPELLERFRAEAVTLGRLAHPAIATLYAFVQEGDEHFMVMEYVPGETLERRMERQGAMEPEEAVTLMNQALSGIAYAHEQGVVHRDLKPANLMVRPDGAVKIMDFGIARALGSDRLTRAGFLVGTLEYMAPEQIRGAEVDPRADLYALGTVLYEMLAGVLPFESDSEYALMQAQVEQAPPPLRTPDAPPALAGAVMRALEKAPEDRFSDADSFRQALLEAIAPEPNVPMTRAAQPAVRRPRIAFRFRPPALPAALRRPSRSLLTALAGVTGVALLLATAWAVGVLPRTPSALSDPDSTQTPATVALDGPAAAEAGPEADASSVSAGGAGASPGRLGNGAPRPPEVLPLPEKEPSPSNPQTPLDDRRAERQPERTDADRAARPRQSTLRVVVHPYGNVFIDGAARAEGRNAHSERLALGTYRVRVVHPVYGAWEKTVRLPSGGRDVVFDFKTQRQVTVTSDPPHAEIIVDGQPTGRFTPSRLSLHQGERVIEVRKDGFRSADGARRLTLEADAEAPLHFSLEPTRP